MIESLENKLIKLQEKLPKSDEVERGDLYDMYLMSFNEILGFNRKIWEFDNRQSGHLSKKMQEYYYTLWYFQAIIDLYHHVDWGGFASIFYNYTKDEIEALISILKRFDDKLELTINEAYNLLKPICKFHPNASFASQNPNVDMYDIIPENINKRIKKMDAKIYELKDEYYDKVLFLYKKVAPKKQLNKELTASKQALSHRPKPTLCQFENLTCKDFKAHPVWVNCHVEDFDENWYDETDEETFRPWDRGFTINLDESIFLISATFTFKDGTKMSGFITPKNSNDTDNDLGTIQPQIFMPDGKFMGFWFGSFEPPKEVILNFYTTLNKSKEDIFPITFKAKEGVCKGVLLGKILGFYSQDKNGKIKIDK